MEEKKNQKGLVWLIVILIIMVLGLVGFIVYDKILTKDNTTVSDNETTTTIVTTTQSDSIKTYDYVYVDNSIQDSDIKKALVIVSNLGFLSNGYKWDFGEKTELNYSDLTEKEKNAMVLSYLIMNKKGIYKGSNTYGDTYKISKEDFSDAIYNVFGNVDYKWAEEFIHNENIYTLTEEKDYEMDHEPTGREDDKDVYILLDSKKTEEKIEITVAYYYMSYDEEVNNDGESIMIDNVYDKNNNRICGEDDVKKHINELQQYKFVFEKNENNYTFDKIIKLN